jgi:hypothetical protein
VEAKFAPIFSSTDGETSPALHAARLISSAVKKIDEETLIVIKTPCISQPCRCSYGLYILRGSLSEDYLNVRGHARENGVPGGLTAVLIVMVTAQIH